MGEERGATLRRHWVSDMRSRRIFPAVLAGLAALSLAWTGPLLAAERIAGNPPDEAKPPGPPRSRFKIAQQKDGPVVGIKLKGDAAPGDCFEAWRGNRLVGYVEVTEMAGPWPKIAALLGEPRVGDDLVPLPLPMLPVELLTDEPEGQEAKEIKALCGEKLTIEKFGETMKIPAQDNEGLIVLIHGGVPFMMGDPIVQPYARRGGTVIADTLAYSHLQGNVADEASFKEPPTLRIIAEGGLTSGFPPESRIPWYGTRGKKFVARYFPGLPERDTSVKLIATDGSTNNSAMLDADLGGHMFVMDLITPNGRAGRDPGAKNKLIFVARALGTGPRYARYMPSRPEFDDLMGWFDTLAESHKGQLVKTFEAGGDRKESYIYSFNIGAKEKPLVVFAGCIQGTDWLGAAALLRLAELLLDNPDRDPKIDQVLERFRIRILPVVNVMGYRNKTVATETGCELDRNFPYHWEEFANAKARGREPFAEAGSATVRRAVEEEKAVAFLEIGVDPYDAGYRIVRARDATEPQQALLRGFHTVLNARLLHRFVVGDQPLQLRLTRDAQKPSAVNWAGSKGALAASLRICGDGEDSITNNDVAVEACLHFLYAAALAP